MEQAAMDMVQATVAPVALGSDALIGCEEDRGGAAVLRDALLDSRQRWRDLVYLSADLVFETDIWGRFVLIGPDPVLGWSVGLLTGQPAEFLLAELNDQHGASGGFNPFRPTGSVRRRRAWLRRADGGSICMAFAAAPLLDAEGRIIGARGIGQDVTEQDQHDAAMAAALRRGELIDHILWRMRQEVLAPRMMSAALEALAGAVAAEGCAVLDMLGDGVTPAILHQTGGAAAAIVPTALSLLESDPAAPVQTMAPDGRVVLACPSETRFGEQSGFVIWRPAGGRSWDADEIVLAGSASSIIRVILEHEAIQRELARQARTDPLTGLANRRAFLDEMARRVERLERQGEPGTLLFVDLDHFKALNDARGHDVGDAALCLTGELLRRTVRPADLVARLGGDEFALWLDGADSFAAAERAESLRIEGPKALAHLWEGPELAALSMSIGIATRWPGQGESCEAVIRRADQAMYEVKRGGRGFWLVSQGDADASGGVG
jgi:diguanylate cyclase (GGDEF)-like protein/PAS domain S-box-containing protein